MLHVTRLSYVTVQRVKQSGINYSLTIREPRTTFVNLTKCFWLLGTEPCQEKVRRHASRFCPKTHTRQSTNGLAIAPRYSPRTTATLWLQTNATFNIQHHKYNKTMMVRVNLTPKTLSTTHLQTTCKPPMIAAYLTLLGLHLLLWRAPLLPPTAWGLRSPGPTANSLYVSLLSTSVHLKL